MPRPRVSVLLPVYNAAATLEAALDSLSRQTLEDFEVVCVDDGSCDLSPDLLARRAAQDERFLMVSTAHEGLVEALNHGLSLCRAPLVARLDADDIAHPRRLESQIRLLDERPEVGVVSCLVRSFPLRRVERGYRIYEDWINGLSEHADMARERFVESPVAHPSVVFRREQVEAVGGYRDRNWAEDYDLWLRLFEIGAVFAKVPRFHHFWREDAARLSRTSDAYSTRNFLRCKAHYLARGPAAPPVDVIVWGAGVTGKRLMRPLLEAGCRIKAAVDIDPAKIGGTVRGLQVFGADDLAGLLSPGTVVLAAVASRGARDLIRARLNSLGLVEGDRYWCVA